MTEIYLHFTMRVFTYLTWGELVSGLTCKFKSTLLLRRNSVSADRERVAFFSFSFGESFSEAFADS